MKELTQGIIMKTLQNGQNLSFSRWGDGEWNCILGSKEPANCDGHQYFDDLGKQLRYVVSQERKYYLGMQDLAKKQRTGQTEFDMLTSKNEWVQADFLHRASARGEFKKLISTLRSTNRKVVLVAPKYLQELGIADVHIVIPENNCWQHRKETIKALNKVYERNVVYLYCASMATNVYINYMWDKYLTTMTQIDCGSIFEPYVGRVTRSYHKKVLEQLGKSPEEIQKAVEKGKKK